MAFGIIFIVCIGIFSGIRRGLSLQILHTVGYLISLWVALRYYKKLAQSLVLLIPYPAVSQGETLVMYDEVQALHLDQAFYRAVAFIFILMLGWFLTRALVYFIRHSLRLPGLTSMDHYIAGGLGFLCNYVGLFLFLSVLAMVPVESVQKLYQHRSLADRIVEDTPILSQQAKHWWLDE